MRPFVKPALEDHRLNLVYVVEVANNSRMVGERLMIGASATNLLGPVKQESENPVYHCQ